MRAQRVRRSPEEARAEILRGAHAALAEADFSALTVDAVMSQTGMTRSSFYHYFSGLDDVALALLEQFESDIRASVDPWLRGEVPGDPRDTTEVHLTAMFEVLRTHQTSVYAVSQASGGHPKVYAEWQGRVLGYFIELTARFIRRQITLGRSRVDDPDRLAQALILMNNAVINDNIARKLEIDPPAVARVLAHVWNAAIYAEGA